MQNKDLSRYLWKGLDLERYAVVKIIPQDKEYAVILMFSRDKDDPHWCLEYKGNGHYFDTAQQMMDYFHSRKFKHPPEKLCWHSHSSHFPTVSGGSVRNSIFVLFVRCPRGRNIAFSHHGNGVG